MPCWRALKYRVGKKISPSQVKIELYYRINSITTKGGIIIPNTDFTTLMLNIQESDIESSFNAVSGDELHIYITLRRKSYDCTFCGGKMIGYGHKMRKINHPALRQYNGTIHYNANRYRCKECGRTRLEDNPFSYRGFNSSFLLQKEVMDKICNLNNSMKAISEEFNISETKLNNYLDSYVTIPRRPLPEWLGIDELHSDNLSRKHASYICILTDCEKRDLYDVLDSRSKRSLTFAILISSFLNLTPNQTIDRCFASDSFGFPTLFCFCRKSLTYNKKLPRRSERLNIYPNFLLGRRLHLRLSTPTVFGMVKRPFLK